MRLPFRAAEEGKRIMGPVRLLPMTSPGPQPDPDPPSVAGSSMSIALRLKA